MTDDARVARRRRPPVPPKVPPTGLRRGLTIRAERGFGIDRSGLWDKGSLVRIQSLRPYKPLKSQRKTGLAKTT